MRVKLGVRHSSDPVAAPLNRIADQAIVQLPQEIQALVDCSPTESKADWVLQVLSPADAAKYYQRKVEQPSMVLLKAAGQSGDPSSSEKFWTTYLLEPTAEAKQIEGLSAQLANDLQKIFAWQNVWRVAGRAANPAGSDLKLEIIRQHTDPAGTPARDPNMLHLGEKISIKLCNEGIDDWWITLLHLDPHFGIDVWINDSIQGKRAYKDISATLSGKSLGPEGIVLLATPMAAQKQRPDYKSLEQTPLGDQGSFRSMKASSATPLGKLMAGASLGKRTRGPELDLPDQPQVIMCSWLTLPEQR